MSFSKKKKEYHRAQYLATCFLISSLMTCFILLTNIHCAITQMTTPYLLLPRVFKHDVVSNLETDCEYIMELSSINSLQANPSKFQFLLWSSSNIDKCNISLCIDDMILKPKPHVVILGVSLTINFPSISMLILAAQKLQGS